MPIRRRARDLEAWLNRLVPENDPHFEHTLEGPDDMPSHIKMALTRTSETVPFRERPHAARDVAGNFSLGAPPRGRIRGTSL